MLSSTSHTSSEQTTWLVKTNWSLTEYLH